MRIAMIGSGYVGLVSGACFAQFGHDVVCVDKEEGKIARLRKGEMPIYEPGLDRMVIDNVRAGRLAFATDLSGAVGNADAVFIAVGTPTRRGDGHADLSYVYAAAAEIADAIVGYTVVITKSTVPVGTGREVARIIRETRPAAEFDVCSNPEFLREGAAIEDFMKPDRVVIGVESQRARDIMSTVYRPLNLIQTPMVFTNIETAEVTKYAGNAFLATKITFINEIADLFEKVGADVRDAPSLDIVPTLQAAGAKIVAFDPAGMSEAGKLLSGVTFAKTAYEAATSADVLVVITEWHEFRGLDPRRIKEAMRQPRIVDLRNIFNPEEMRGLGFAYEGVGRGQDRIHGQPISANRYAGSRHNLLNVDG